MTLILLLPGNNWANGYCNYGSTMEAELVDAVKVIADQICSISTVLVLMSSAGGLCCFWADLQFQVIL